LFRDLFDTERLKNKLQVALAETNFLLENYYKTEPVSLDALMSEIKMYANELASFRHPDTSLFVHKSLRSGKKVFFEGAQGSLLDILHGTYPYVTSSSTLAGAACVGTGVGPNSIQKVIGIMKAYTTRVGSGPFPTELNDEVGERIQKEGAEFGATTGRKRRCGWLDLVALKYAMRINGVTNLVLMKLDVLSGLSEIKVATHYQLDGNTVEHFSTSSEELQKATPVYKSFSGWSENISKAKNITGWIKNNESCCGSNISFCSSN
jgi:adenylosuccinate synthase